MGKIMSMCAAAAAALPIAAIDLKPGDELSGFVVKDVVSLPEVQGRLVRMEFAKNGADLVWLERDDDNMTFAIGFRTLPSDDTGVPHIIEHSVLCGSDKYPVKEPFVDLLKSSFATFLNAYTSSDHTMYPVCSRNRADLLNLMDVYLDAVFHPLSVKSPLAFRQEGWHYELASADAELTRNGIVYSEMKGAFSTPERRLYHELRRLLYPQTCYGFVSGGDPAAIPTLDFEGYKAFYNRFYHPSNARIFLDGRIDLKAVLAKLQGFLEPYPRKAVDAEIEYQKPVSADKTMQYEIGAAESEEGKVILGDAWVFGKFDEREKCMAVDVLTDALAGSNEAPLKKALLAKGLCEDVYMGVGGAAQVEASLVVKNVKRENVDEVRRTVRSVIASLAEKGLDHARLAALLDRAEFRDREKDFGETPRGLGFLSDAFDFWLYGGDPADAFRNASRFASLRSKIEAGWFERLLREAFLDNPHHASITFVPSRTLAAENAAAEKAALAKVKAGWTKEQLDKVLADCRALEAYQAAPNKPEDVAKLPVLAVKDVPAEAPVIKTEVTTVDGTTVVRPHTQANGVVHAELAFSLADLTLEELADMPMLAAVLGNLATEKHTIEALRNEIDGKLGRFTAGAMAAARGDEASPYLEVDVSALEAKWADVVRLVPEVLRETSFADTNAVGRILKQRRIGAERAATGLSARPLPFRRAAAQLTARGALDETLSGFAQIRRLQSADNAFAAEGSAYCERLAALARRVFTRDRLVMCVTDNAPAAWAAQLAATLPSGAMGAPVAYRPFPRRNEGFRISAGIGFAARVAHPAERLYSGSAVVAARILTLNHLWQEIRVKGGAYGGNFGVRRNGDAGWLSWNDPKPGRSLGVYSGSGDALRAFADGAEAIDRYVIGAVAVTEPYLSASAEMGLAMERHLNGVTAADLQRLRDEMLKTTKADLRAFAAKVDAVAADATVCVLGGAEPIKTCAGQLDVVEDVAEVKNAGK